jgi:hypothetical protein
VKSGTDLYSWVGLDALLVDPWKPYEFWQDLNSCLLVMKSAPLSITPRIQYQYDWRLSALCNTLLAQKMTALFGRGTNDVITSASLVQHRKGLFATLKQQSCHATLKQQSCHGTNDVASLDSHLSTMVKRTSLLHLTLQAYM